MQHLWEGNEAMSKSILHEKNAAGLAILLFFALVVVGSIFLYQANKDAADRANKISKAKKDMASIVVNEEALLAYHKDPFPDPWGNNYAVQKIQGTREGYEIVCYGPDGQAGTPDDLTERITKINWKNAGRDVGGGIGQFGRGLWKGITEEDKDDQK